MLPDLPTPALPPGAGTPVLVPSPGSVAGLRRHLDALARSAHALIVDADGVGTTMLVKDGSVFAGSNPFTDAVDQVQYGLGQGPCLAAVESRAVVRSRSIGAGEPRWTRFTPRAAALELRSVASVPVWADHEVVGSLNVYGRDATTLDGLDVAELRRHAERTGRAIQGARLVAAAAATAEVLLAAARDREDIDLAVGLLMDRYTMTASHARILLGQLATQDQVSTGDAARSLTGPPRPPLHDGSREA